MNSEINTDRANQLLVMLYNEWKYLKNTDRPLKIEWNVMHMFSSSQLAKLHAMKNNLDIELCSIIAILHDVAVVEEKARINHAQSAQKYVLEIIERFNNSFEECGVINDDETNIILEAIIHHSDKAKYTEKPYVEMLKDIDSLDRYLYGIETKDSYFDRTQELLKSFNIE